MGGQNAKSIYQTWNIQWNFMTVLKPSREIDFLKLRTKQ